MKKTWLFWLPRILGIVFVLFISVFAFDVFGEGYKWYEALFAFLMHLVPTFIAIAVLLIAWKWPLIGSIAYFGAGVFYIFVMNEIDWIAVAIISGPLFLTGILFVISHLANKKEPSKMDGS